MTSPQIRTRNDLRNVAIVAYADHGKTTLVDAMNDSLLTHRPVAGPPHELALALCDLELIVVHPRNHLQ